jgi:hypothetical protein
LIVLAEGVLEFAELCPGADAAAFSGPHTMEARTNKVITSAFLSFTMSILHLGQETEYLKFIASPIIELNDFF